MMVDVTFENGSYTSSSGLFMLNSRRRCRRTLFFIRLHFRFLFRQGEKRIKRRFFSWVKSTLIESRRQKKEAFQLKQKFTSSFRCKKVSTKQSISWLVIVIRILAFLSIDSSIGAWQKWSDAILILTASLLASTLEHFERRFLNSWREQKKKRPSSKNASAVRAFVRWQWRWHCRNYKAKSLDRAAYKRRRLSH